MIQSELKFIEVIVNRGSTAQQMNVRVVPWAVAHDAQ